MSSISSSNTLQATIVVFVVFSALQNVNIPPLSITVCLFFVVVIIVEHCCFFYISRNSTTKAVAIWYGVLIVVIVGVWCLILLLNLSFNHNYYDCLSMSIFKAPPACKLL